MLTATSVDGNVECRSLTEESWREANNLRWYLSEEARRDVGECALRQWVCDHWPGFLRARWIEHMLGERFWLELGPDDFGLLQKADFRMPQVVDYVIERLKTGAENLPLVCWLRRQPPDVQVAVRELLRVININAHRLRCHFFDESYPSAAS